jgi:hypothetical protein
MEADSQAKQRVSADVPTEPSKASAPGEVQVSSADAARSEDNILRWMAYLPEDCVRTMIDMGWDITT